MFRAQEETLGDVQYITFGSAASVSKSDVIELRYRIAEQADSAVDCGIRGLRK